MSVYACSDLHGCFEFYQKIADFIKLDDTVFVLGDCGDRGPQSWETIKAVYNHPQMSYLKGNHEDMLVKAMRHAIRSGKNFGREYSLCRSNGGENTFKGWLKETEEQRMFWYKTLDTLPLDNLYINKDGLKIYMNHSGVDEHGSEEEMLWSRDHFFHWTSDFDMIIHGHTPYPLLHKDLIMYDKTPKELKVGAYWYEKNRKVNLDCGTVWTNFIALLDLDTFEEHIFTNENFVGIDEDW